MFRCLPFILKYFTLHDPLSQSDSAFELGLLGRQKPPPCLPCDASRLRMTGWAAAFVTSGAMLNFKKKQHCSTQREPSASAHQNICTYDIQRSLRLLNAWSRLSHFATCALAACALEALQALTAVDAWENKPRLHNTIISVLIKIFTKFNVGLIVFDCRIV